MRSFATVSDAGPAPMHATRLPFFSVGIAGRRSLDVALQIGGNTLQPTNRDGTAIDTAPSTRWLAGAVTRASEDSWKDVRFPVEHVGVVETPLGDEANVTGNVRVSGTRPLTIHYPVVILGS